MKNSIDLKKIQEEDSEWKILVDFTKFKKDGIDINEILKRLEKNEF